MLRKCIVLLLIAILLIPSGLTATASDKKLIKRAIPGVVLIVSHYKSYYGMGRMRGTGSGVVIHPKGYILTNFHNLGSTRTGRVRYRLYAYFVSKKRLYDAPVRKAYKLKIINTNYKYDLALMKIVAVRKGRRFVPISKNSRFSYLRLTDSSKVEPTDSHYALGFPKVARLTRQIFSGITILNGKVVGLDKRTGWIKTNAEISPGNSGGPSINLKGEVIGINSAVKIERQTHGRISLIRPINLARHLAKGTPAFKMFKAGKMYTPDRRYYRDNNGNNSDREREGGDGSGDRERDGNDGYERE